MAIIYSTKIKPSEHHRHPVETYLELEENLRGRHFYLREGANGETRTELSAPEAAVIASAGATH